MPKNSTLKKTIIAVSGGLLIAFVGFTIHKIYIKDVEIYAQKADVSAFVTESRNDRANIKSLAVQNKENIRTISNDLDWIKERQTELKLQNATTNMLQMQILESLKNLNNSQKNK